MTPIEKLIHEASYEAEGLITAKTIREAKAELASLRKLENAARDLNQIVEGVKNERWASDGRRLKDTPEWCAFYVALANFKMPSPNAKISQPEKNHEDT